MELAPESARSSLKLWLDSVLFLAFLVVSAPQATGLAFHEWISFAFVLVLLAHLLLSWEWIVGVSASFFRRLRAETRFNYLLDALLFLVMTVAFGSGVASSAVALPALGLSGTVDPFWIPIHKITATLLFPLLGIHLAMHWRWIVKTARNVLSKTDARAAETS
jgi:hypothetical protein